MFSLFMAQNVFSRGGGLFIRNIVKTFSTTTVTAQNGDLYDSTSFEGYTFDTSSLSNGDSFIISQSESNGGPYTFTNTVADSVIINSKDTTGANNAEVTCVFKWNDQLNVLTFIMKDM